MEMFFLRVFMLWEDLMEPNLRRMREREYVKTKKDTSSCLTLPLYRTHTLLSHYLTHTHFFLTLTHTHSPLPLQRQEDQRLEVKYTSLARTCIQVFFGRKNNSFMLQVVHI